MVLLCLMATMAFAETVVLKSGRTVKGAIIERTAKAVKLNISDISVTYWADEIERIEAEVPAGASADVQAGPAAPQTANDQLAAESEQPVSAGQAQGVYYNEKHGLRIVIPAGWEVIDEKNPALFGQVTGGVSAGVICVLRQKEKEESPLVYVKSNLLAKSYTIEEYVATLAERNKQIAATNTSLSLLENARLVERDGRKFSKSISEFKDPRGNETYVYYHFLSGGMSYSVIGSLPSEQFAGYKTLFDDIAASVSFEGQGADPKELADGQQLFLFGNQYFAQQQFDSAIAYYERALEKISDNTTKVQALTMLSSCYLEKGIQPYIKDKNDADYQRAIAYAEQARALDAAYWPATANIAIIHMNKDELEKANEYFEEARKHAESGTPGYDQLVFQHELMKKKLEAKKTPAQ